MSTPQATNHQGLTPVISARKQEKSSSPWTERKAEARRRRRDAGRTQRELDALALAQELLLLADRAEYTPWRGELNALVTHVRKSGKRTPDRDATAVAAALGNPFNRNGATVKDLEQDTKIPAPELQKILDGMISVETVRRFPKDVPEIARGATIWLYTLTGKQPSTPHVLP